MFDVWNLMLKTLDEMSTFSKDIYNDETGTNRNSKFERLITTKVFEIIKPSISTVPTLKEDKRQFQ